jgi:hypothetical protein
LIAAVAPLLLAVMAATSPAGSGLSVTVAPDHVAIADLAPGVPRSAQVSVTNDGTVGALLTVRGELTAPGAIDPADVLHVSLAGCTQPWSGMPDAPVCDTGEVATTDGALAGIPLEVGARLWVLITAGLGQDAGDGAQGQTWTADMTLTAAASGLEPAPALAFTGASVTPLAGLALALLGTGSAVARTVSRARQKGQR